MFPYFERNYFLSEYCLLIMKHHQNIFDDVKVKFEKTNQLNHSYSYSKDLRFEFEDSFSQALEVQQDA
jgi:hypothetical protein